MAVYTYTTSEFYPQPINEYPGISTSTASVYIIVDDYGLISEGSVSNSLDYGSVVDTPETAEDYYSITITENLPAFGFIRNIVSNTEYSTLKASVGGIEFVLQGGSYSSFGSAYVGYDLTTITGAATNIKNTESYVGSGSIFGFGSKAERISFSYNESSAVGDIIVDDFGNITDINQFTEDYGTVTESPTSYENYYYLLNITIDDCGSISAATEDIDSYGLVSESPVYYDDYGNLELPPSYDLDKKPFGFIKFSGAATNIKNTESYVGYNYASITGSGLISILPQHVGSGTISILGAATNIKNTESYVGSGSLFSLNSSVEIFGANPPVSGLFKFSGNVVQKNTESYVGSGSLFSYNGSAEAFGANPPENIQLFRFSGAATDIKNTESYFGSGSAFGFISKEEKTTFSYNESSVIGDIIVDDYGNINEFVTNIDDYGSITDPVLRSENYEGLSVVPVRKPFGFSRFSGAVVEKNTESYVGSGSLFSYNGSAEAFGANPPENIQLFRFSGSSVQKNTESYVGSGSAFGFVSKEERITFSYNEYSVNYREDIDYGLITDYSGIGQEILPYANNQINDLINEIVVEFNSTLNANDYEFITDTPDSYNDYFDYGFVSTLPRRPFGFSRFSGAVVQKNTESYVGSGSLFSYTGSAEAFGANPPENTQLFRLSGSSSESYTPTTEIGSGRLFGVGSKLERTTYSYNESSVVGDATLNDYGFISYVADEVDDYGNLHNSSTAYEDLGLISTPVKKPYGFSKFSGSLTDLKVRLCYFGSGSLFAYTGSAEAFGANPPENIQLFRFSGAVVQKNTESYVGSGSLFSFNASTEVTSSTQSVSGLFKFSGSLVEKNTESYVGTGLLSIDGKADSAVKPQYDGFGRVTIFDSAKESFSEGLYTGTGSLFTAGGHAEAFIANPPESTELFKISGSAIEKNTESYVGSGSLFSYTGSAEAFGANPPENIQLFRFSGSLTESYTPATEVGSGSLLTNRPFVVLDPEDKVRLSNIHESFSFRPKPSTIEMSLTGELGIYFVNIYQGLVRFRVDGAATIKTNPVHVGSGIIQSGGNCQQSFVPAPHKGSGSLFAYTGSAEASVANPPVSGLFKFSGSSAESILVPQTGQGIARFDINSLILIKFDYPVKGKIDISGNSIEIKTQAYNGKGKTEISGDAGVYFANKFVSVGDPIRIYANGKENITIPQIGSGSLFGFVSKTEIFGANPPEKTALFKLSGSVQDKFTQSQIGFGIVKFHQTTTLFDIEGKQRVVGSYESVSSTPPLKSRALNIKGTLDSERNTETFIGSGSLFGFGSRVEVFGANPPEKSVLFKISGKAQETGTKRKIGSGSLFSYSGSAEAFSPNPPENTQLFKISGASKESYTPATEIGSGKLFGFGGASETTSVSEVSRVIFEFNGSSNERINRSYSGEGSIFGLGGSSQSKVYIFKPSERAFRIFGRSFGSFAYGNYYGECASKMVGKSSDQKIDYEEPKPTILYII